MALVMVSAPYPAGSSVSISPPAAVLEIAPANVLHGAVREHGLTSSPTPEIHVRVACACATFGASIRHAPMSANAIPVNFIPASSRLHDRGAAHRRGETSITT